MLGPWSGRRSVCVRRLSVRSTPSAKAAKAWPPHGGPCARSVFRSGVFVSAGPRRGVFPWKARRRGKWLPQDGVGCVRLRTGWRGRTFEIDPANDSAESIAAHLTKLTRETLREQRRSEPCPAPLFDWRDLRGGRRRRGRRRGAFPRILAT